MENNGWMRGCRQLLGWGARCHAGRCPRRSQNPAALSQSCCGCSLRVSGLLGDRKTCARMASLGIMPGQELELLCKAGQDQCIVKMGGHTISLDAATAASILVAPV